MKHKIIVTGSSTKRRMIIGSKASSASSPNQHQHARPARPLVNATAQRPDLAPTADRLRRHKRAEAEHAHHPQALLPALLHAGDQQGHAGGAAEEPEPDRRSATSPTVAFGTSWLIWRPRSGCAGRDRIWQQPFGSWFKCNSEVGKVTRRAKRLIPVQHQQQQQQL
ncbi:hypothetical protein ACLOJK_001003 [Asimina triloba]